MASNIDWIGSLVELETDLNDSKKHLPLRGICRQSVSHLTGTDLLQKKELKLNKNK
jgi:hypothetical protein